MVKGVIPGIDIVVPKVLKRESYYLKKKWKSDACQGQELKAYITPETRSQDDKELPQWHKPMIRSTHYWLLQHII